MWTFFDLLAFATGFAACWFSKDKIVQTVAGTEAFAKALEVKVAALKASL